MELKPHEFDACDVFVEALLTATENRSHGRVEQALVGAKLQIRYPNENVAIQAAFAGDAQTNRESDFAIGELRVVVSVTPKDSHYKSAISLARDRRRVTLVVSDKSVNSARNRIRDAKISGIQVRTVTEYVAGNMDEIAQERKISSHEMCMELLSEYNKRIIRDNDPSLQVVPPAKRS